LALQDYYEFFSPTKVMFGPGLAQDVGAEVEGLGGSAAMLITDKGIIGAGLLQTIEKSITDSEVDLVEVYSDVPVNSEVAVCEAIAEIGRAAGVDTLISVGGGSVIDTTKGVNILLGVGGDLMEDWQGTHLVPEPLKKHIAIPTTAGTGSEATHVAMITDEGRNRKLMYQGGDLIPSMAVLDPRMTISLPPAMTAATGMDALTHAIEALHSTWHQPITDGLAQQAIGLVDLYLERCFNDGADVFARMNMLLAANMGGVAASNSFIGIVHATAHPLGGLFHIPHGVAVGMMLPYCMEMNLAYEGIPAIYRKVAGAMGLARESDDDEAASRKAVERVRGLVQSLGLPADLKEAGVPADSIQAYIDEVMEDRAMMVTPGNPGRQEVEELISRAYQGRSQPRPPKASHSL
jgi:alcohol dehydrogenase class IV